MYGNTVTASNSVAPAFAVVQDGPEIVVCRRVRAAPGATSTMGEVHRRDAPKVAPAPSMRTRPCCTEIPHCAYVPRRASMIVVSSEAPADAIALLRALQSPSAMKIG